MFQRDPLGNGVEERGIVRKRNSCSEVQLSYSISPPTVATRHEALALVLGEGGEVAGENTFALWGTFFDVYLRSNFVVSSFKAKLIFFDKIYFAVMNLMELWIHNLL